jgi:hypothetical protein
LLAVSGCGAPPPATEQAQFAQPVAVAPRPDVDLSPYEKGRSQPVKDPVFPAYGNPAIDVLHYDLTLDWKPSSRTLTGTAKLTLRAVKPVTRLTVDFGRAEGRPGHGERHERQAPADRERPVRPPGQAVEGR